MGLQFLRQRTTLIIVGLFAGRKWKNMHTW